jgi:hypothetical protein
MVVGHEETFRGGPNRSLKCPLHSTIRHYLERLDLVAGQQLIGYGNAGTACPDAARSMSPYRFFRVARGGFELRAGDLVDGEKYLQPSLLPFSNPAA